MSECANIIDYATPPASSRIGAWHFFKELIVGVLLGLVIDAAVLGSSLLFGVSPIVIGIFAWVLIPVFLLVFRHRFAMATGILIAMPIWPFVAYVVLMLASGITC